MNDASKILVTLAALCLLLAACDDVLENYNFQNWCGERLCDWTLEEGDYERVSTWHEGDYGVSFLQSPTTLSQAVPDTSLPSGCMRFEIVSHVESDAEFRLELDFDDDGSVEVERTLEHANWERTVFFVNPPVDYTSVRILVVKYGEGEGVLASLRARDVSSEEGCAGPPIPSSTAPLEDEAWLP